MTLGAGPGGCGPEGSKSILYKHTIVMLHIKSKVMKSRIQWCKILPQEHVWGSIEVKKSKRKILDPIFDCHPTLLRLF